MATQGIFCQNNRRGRHCSSAGAFTIAAVGEEEAGVAGMAAAAAAAAAARPLCSENLQRRCKRLRESLETLWEWGVHQPRPDESCESVYACARHTRVAGMHRSARRSEAPRYETTRLWWRGRSTKAASMTRGGVLNTKNSYRFKFSNQTSERELESQLLPNSRRPPVALLT